MKGGDPLSSNLIKGASEGSCWQEPTGAPSHMKDLALMSGVFFYSILYDHENYSGGILPDWKLLFSFSLIFDKVDDNYQALEYAKSHKRTQ